ncbi:MAG: hypothetical protein WBE44_17640 [Terriglobales bacterium]|jgi:hypothetical protein
MRKVAWNDRQIGDVFLYAGTVELSRMIIDAEKVINPPNPPHIWVPSHAGIFGPKVGQVTEAWLDFEESSAAAVHPDAKYTGEYDLGRMQIWRPSTASDFVKQATIQSLVSNLGPKPYGVLAILGFEYEVAEELLFGHARENPVKHATVCSMTALIYLRWISEAWARTVDLQNCSPDVLLRNIEANATA